MGFFDFLGGSGVSSAPSSSGYASTPESLNQLFGNQSGSFTLADRGQNVGGILGNSENQFSWMRPDRAQLAGAIGAAGEEARNVTNEENRRFTEQSAFFGDEFSRANQPTFTQGDIDRFYGAQADRIGADSAQLQSNLRESLGQSGIRGGEAAGFGAAIELQRLGQLTGARRDLEVLKANTDRQDRLDRYQRAQGLVAYRSQSPSTFFSDFLSSNVDTQLGLYGIDKQVEAADKARASNEQAALLNFFGNAISSFAG